jgi:hypothetical protein
MKKCHQPVVFDERAWFSGRAFRWHADDSTDHVAPDEFENVEIVGNFQDLSHFLVNGGEEFSFRKARLQNGRQDHMNVCPVEKGHRERGGVFAPFA